MKSVQPTELRVSLEKESIERRILETLARGPALRLGSDRETDRALQRLRKVGKIRYVKVNEGGKGWELVASLKVGETRVE